MLLLSTDHPVIAVAFGATIGPGIAPDSKLPLATSDGAGVAAGLPAELAGLDKSTGPLVWPHELSPHVTGVPAALTVAVARTELRMETNTTSANALTTGAFIG